MIPALGELTVKWERDIDINYTGVMNALIKFRAGCSAAPLSYMAVVVYFIF